MADVWRRISIRRRFVAVTAFGLVVAVLVVTLCAFLVARSALEDELNRSVRQQSDQIVRSVRNRSIDYVVTGPCAYAAAPACARVVDDQARPVVLDGITSGLPIPAGAGAVAAGQIGSFYTDASVDGEPFRILVSQLTPGRALLVAESSTDLRADLRDLEIALAITGAVGLIILTVVTLLLTRVNLAPIGALVQDTHRIAKAGDPSLRVDDSGADEASELAGSFNAVLAQLERAMTTQQQLIADAAHQLRTPLTSLRANVDVLARADDRLTVAQRQAAVKDLDVEVRDLITLVNGLLDLARGEDPGETMEPVRLDDLVDRCVRKAVDHWPKATFATDLDPCLIMGEPTRLSAAISAVLDNAAKFAGRAGPITVVLRKGVLAITDRGPGIEPESRERVFDRFYRAPAAGGTAGSGLGLAITRAIMDAHSATVRAEPGRGGRGTSIVMQFNPEPDVEP